MRKEVEVGDGAFQTNYHVQNQLSWSHMVSLCLTIWRSCPSVFQSGGIILHYQQVGGFQFLTSLSKLLDSGFGFMELYSPWNSPGQNTGAGSLSLLQGIFPTQRSNPGLQLFQILFPLHLGEVVCGHISVCLSPLLLCH